MEKTGTHDHWLATNDHDGEPWSAIAKRSGYSTLD